MFTDWQCQYQCTNLYVHNFTINAGLYSWIGKLYVILMKITDNSFKTTDNWYQTTDDIYKTTANWYNRRFCQCFTSCDQKTPFKCTLAVIYSTLWTVKHLPATVFSSWPFLSNVENSTGVNDSCVYGERPRFSRICRETMSNWDVFRSKPNSLIPTLKIL